eukprot:SAG22_NODE_10828_length_514_cov_0.874699_1_plen_28_part_01
MLQTGIVPSAHVGVLASRQVGGGGGATV